MLHICTQDKRGTILNAALEVFITYGFRKTSMDDIARTAGMSRPALYHSFRNKTEIFRELIECLMRDAVGKAEAVLATGGDFRKDLFRAIDVSILEMHRFVEPTAHGKELIGVSDEIAADIGDIWTNSLVRIIHAALNRAAAEGRISLDRHRCDAETIARTFVFALEGLRWEVQQGRPVEHHVRAAVDFFADALAPEPAAEAGAA